MQVTHQPKQPNSKEKKDKSQNSLNNIKNKKSINMTHFSDHSFQTKPFCRRFAARSNRKILNSTKSKDRER